MKPSQQLELELEPAESPFAYSFRMPGGIWVTAHHRLACAWWFNVEERRS